MKSFHRSEILQKRNALSWDEVLEKSNAIHDRLFKSETFKKAKTVAFYVSKDNEVFTHAIIKSALNCKTVVVPKVTSVKNKVMEMRQIDDFSDLSPGYFDVLEPISGKAIEKSEIDLVIVPVVAFDRMCHRIGHGLGFYDMYLNDFGTATIGLAFNIQMIDEVPRKAHDIPLDVVMTESGIIVAKSD